MENFTETDTEFWKDLDAPQSIPFTSDKKIPIDSKIATFTSNHPQHKENFEKLLNQARLAFKQRYTDKLKLRLHKQSEYYQKQIQDIKEVHRSEINDLIRKFYNLDETLINRDIQISGLQKFFIGQETDLAFTRIKVNTTAENQGNLNVNEIISDEKLVFEQQISVFKELLGIYERDIDGLKVKIWEMEQEIADGIRNHELELFEIKRKMEVTQNDCKKKVRDVNQKYQVFKNDVGAEFKLKDTIIRKQRDDIVRVKEELTLAKMVLDTPRLLFKYNMKEPYRNRQARSLVEKPLKSSFHSKAILRSKRFDSNETLISTRATPIFTMTPEPEYSSSMLPTLSEVDYYKY